MNTTKPVDARIYFNIFICASAAMSSFVRRIPNFRFKNRNTIINYKSYAHSEGYFSSVTGTMPGNL
jgi:hypothetical protein